MKVYIDTNVLIDYLYYARPNHVEAVTIFTLFKKGLFEASVSAQSVIDASYVYMNKEKLPRELFLRAIREMLLYVKIPSIDVDNIRFALSSSITDFEDAAQIGCAMAARCNLIISSDRKMKNNGLIKVFTPEEFLAKVF